MKSEEEYQLQENENLIMKFAVSKKDKIQNIITVYSDIEGHIHIHNSNGIKQDICPNLRASGNLFFCQKYLDARIKESPLPLENWELYNCDSSFEYKNPIYKNCQELNESLEKYKNCKWL